ncbi:MAG: restriction endonuclease subunit S [Sulfurovum sp.]|nr:restriction endonuclease subunit S [Sulfurovum sp.]
MSELYELPEEWEWKKINDIIVKTKNITPKNDSQSNFTYIDISSIDNNIFSIVSPKTILGKDAPSRAKKEVQVNDIVFATTRPNLKNIAIVKEEYSNPVASTGFCILRTKNKENKYLFFYLLSNVFYKQVEKHIRGAQYPAISDRDVKFISIPFPPLQEQKRIVAKLDSLFVKIDQAIALHQQNIDEADALMGSVLNEVFGELEERYETKQLKEFTKITSSKRIHKADYVESGIPFYRSKEIILKSKMIELTDILYISEETFINFKNKFGVPKEGDILITAVGTIGVTYLVNSHDEFYFKDGNLIWLRDIRDELNKKYLLYSFKSPQFQNYIDEISKGAAQKALTIIKLNELKIPIPNIETQQKTVTYLDQLSQKTEKLKQTQQEKMQSLKDLKASLLDRAFRGEL